MRGGGWHLRVLGICLAVSLGASSGCNDGDSGSTTPSAGAAGQAQNGAGGTNGGSATTSGGAANGGSGGIMIVGGGAGGMTSAGGGPSLDTIVAPLVLCGSGEGGSAGQPEEGAAGAPVHDDACAPPPSQCVDRSWLGYFSEGECVDGRCRWLKQATRCNELCTDGGCYTSITAI